MAGKPRARCPLFLVCSDISTASDNKVEFFPAVFSDVMPLWFGLIPGGCTKGSAAIWSVIPQLWVKLRNFHLGEDASPSLSLSVSLSHMRAHTRVICLCEHSQHMCTAEGAIKWSSAAIAVVMRKANVKYFSPTLLFCTRHSHFAFHQSGTFSICRVWRWITWGCLNYIYSLRLF